MQINVIKHDRYVRYSSTHHCDRGPESAHRGASSRSQTLHRVALTAVSVFSEVTHLLSTPSTAWLCCQTLSTAPDPLALATVI